MRLIDADEVIEYYETWEKEKVNVPIAILLSNLRNQPTAYDEEQGRLIELPCAVGDTVYHIRDPLEGEPSIVKVKFSYFWLEQWDTTFLTKEEAERKLKELEGVKE